MTMQRVKFPARIYRSDDDVERAADQVRSERKRKALERLREDAEYFSACLDAHDHDRQDADDTLYEVIHVLATHPRHRHTLDMIARAIEGFLDELAHAEVERLEVDDPITQGTLPF